jgi:hypothetical protein
VIVAFTWDWSSWYAALLYVLGGVALVGTVVGHVYGFWGWLGKRLHPAPTPPEPPSKRPAVVLGHPGASISLTPLHELAQGEHSRVIKVEPLYVIENNDALRPIRDVTTGVRRRDGREHTFEKFRAPMIGPKESAEVRNVDSIALDMLDGLHVANPELEFLYWARFEDDDGRRWEAAYDPQNRMADCRELPSREPLVSQGAALLTDVKEFIRRAHPMVASIEEQPGAIKARLDDLEKEWKSVRPKLLAYTNGHPSEDIRQRGDELTEDVEKLLMADRYLANPIVEVAHKAAAAESAFNRHASATGLAEQLLTKVRNF